MAVKIIHPDCSIDQPLGVQRRVNASPQTHAHTTSSSPDVISSSGPACRAPCLPRSLRPCLPRSNATAHQQRRLCCARPLHACFSRNLVLAATCYRPPTPFVPDAGAAALDSDSSGAPRQRFGQAQVSCTPPTRSASFKAFWARRAPHLPIASAVARAAQVSAVLP